jgi:hypothetical protein
VLQMLRTVPRKYLPEHLELLRDEFVDEKRQALAERGNPDA